MAKPSRSDTGASIDFATLNTYDAITEELQQIPDKPGKLIIILFNIRYPDRFTLESRIKNWQKNFQKTYNVQFFKCIVTDGKQDVKEKYQIKHSPTVIFFRAGNEVDRIADFEESDPDIADTSEPGADSNDETKLKRKIIKLHQKE